MQARTRVSSHIDREHPLPNLIKGGDHRRIQPIYVNCVWSYNSNNLLIRYKSKAFDLSSIEIANSSYVIFNAT
jgi:hypothetical protein